MSMVSGFKVFEPLAASFTLNAPLDAPHWESMLLVDILDVAASPGEPVLKAPEIRLWFDRTCKPGFDALCRKLSSWLSSLEIPSNQSVVDATLAIVAATLRPGRTLVDSLTLLESSVREADLSHFAILNTNLPSSWTVPMEWRGFELGPLNIKKLESRCSRAGESLDISTLQYLKQRPAISSPIYQRNVFALEFLFDEFSEKDCPVGSARLTYEWFRAVQSNHWREMWADFEERRALIYALGFGLVDGNTFRNNPAQSQISCYLKLRIDPKNEGYVVFGQPITQINLPDLIESNAGISEIAEICNLAEIEKSSLHQTINAYAMTLCRGTSISLEGHISESYLHLIIALEQLFSSRDNTSQMVAGRTAVLVHRQLGIPFAECRKSLLKEHYDARSRFVHSAVAIPHNLVEPISNITQAVLRSLLWLAKGEESHSPDFFETWLKRLDWIIAGYEAGIQPPDDVLDANGIITSDALPLP